MYAAETLFVLEVSFLLHYLTLEERLDVVERCLKEAAAYQGIED